MWIDWLAAGELSTSCAQLDSYLRQAEMDFSENVSLIDGVKNFCLRNSGKGILVLISDLMDKEGYDKALRFLVAQQMDVYVIHVLSPEGWLDTGDMAYLKDGSLYIVGRAKDMIIINGKNHWPQDIEWAIEQLPGFKAGDIAAFSITTSSGEEAPAVLVQCRTSDNDERIKLREAIKTKVKAITGMSCVVELVPPRTLPRTSSGKLSRSKARMQYLSGEIQPFEVAA